LVKAPAVTAVSFLSDIHTELNNDVHENGADTHSCCPNQPEFATVQWRTV